MHAAVCTATADSIDLIEPALTLLRENAGVIEYDLYVYDEDSHDGTAQYLEKQFDEGVIYFAQIGKAKIGWARAINSIATKAIRHGGYDAIIIMAPYLTEMTPGTIAGLTRASKEADALVSPIPEVWSKPPLGPVTKTTAGNIRDTGQLYPFLYATPPAIWTRTPMPEDTDSVTAVFADIARQSGYLVGYLEGYRAL